jgi:hypothetical protein
VAEQAVQRAAWEAAPGKSNCFAWRRRNAAIAAALHHEARVFPNQRNLI